MAKTSRNSGSSRRSSTTKYDAHNTVLDKTYGALADLRRELADSKAAVAERTEILNMFASCRDSQRAWLLLEDYFEKLSLARRDFPNDDWWTRLFSAQGNDRLEETALLFIRSKRPLPTELVAHANFARFEEIQQAEREQELIAQLENWLLPPAHTHLDSPRAALRVLCQIERVAEDANVHCLKVSFGLFRPRTGEKTKTIGDIIELTTRAAHEQELFPTADWQFVLWLSENYGDSDLSLESIRLCGVELLQWLARWGEAGRLIRCDTNRPLTFRGQLASLAPRLENGGADLHFTHSIHLPHGEQKRIDECLFFASQPALILSDHQFFLVQNAPPETLLGAWLDKPLFPVKKLSRRLLTALRKNGEQWESLCTAHTAEPQFTFELEEDTVRLRLLARSDLDASLWQWNGHEWQRAEPASTEPDKPEVLDDPRLAAAISWLRRLDWFTPEPGLWLGDANENFLNTLSAAWPERPSQALYLGNQEFQHLFLSPRQLRPKLVVQGSGIDWFSVSSQWEAEGMKLTPADLERLQSATGRFVKLPDAGWVQLDLESVQKAHEAMADVGIDGLTPVAQRIDLSQAASLGSDALSTFQNHPHAKALHERIAEFTGVPPTPLPAGIKADLRPYQKEGFDFLCHLSRMRLGGVLADDMGLGKTLQTLAYLAFLREQSGENRKPALVICPASVLHNWRREANRFLPDFQVLVLESGSARHNLRKQIPENDLIVTNYALLRRDLPALQKFYFSALILDEAQFIKNPTAQVTQCVKQLNAEHRLALTGTPLENRLLDLWSIVDFIQPTYLGTQEQFTQTYESRGENADWSQKIARRRLAAKLRPLLIRRLKKQVAQDLPDRIEERRDCELGQDQRKLYLAELRRSREQVLKTITEQGLAKSKIQVLAALTRLRQICCHPQLVGSDTPSGKTETLFELLEPLLAQGQKVLVFSQFVQMLHLLDAECKTRQMPTYILTGQTKNRQDIVNAFQADTNPSVFLLSLRAAGTGLNLTTASYVVLYDPWWNPAVEAQAIDRSHRIGQTRTVNAYRLITPGTVEEKIWELQQNKAQTIADVLGEEGFARNLTKGDLEYLFAED